MILYQLKTTAPCRHFLLSLGYMQKEMQNKITRLLYELNALDKGPVCLEDMAGELGVSLRTLQRDMRTIQEADFPLYCPHAGEYAFMEGFSLEKAHLSEQEASMLVFMSEMAKSLGQPFGNSFDLLKKRLLGTQNDSPFFIKLSSGEEFPDTAITKELAECIRAREKVTVCYEGGKRACYPVRPLKLLWVDGFWYLLALTDDDKLLKFRLEKITSATALGKFFKYNAGIEKIIREGTNIWFDKKREMEIELEISAQAAKYFKVKNYFPMQKVKQELPDGRLIITCRATGEDEIKHTIFHWIPEIKVLAPQELAQKVKTQLKKYMEEV